MFGDVRISKEELWQAARAGEQMDYEAESMERVRRREERELSPVGVALRQAIGPVGDDRPADTPDRSAVEISVILEQIDGLAQTAAQDLMEGPSRFSLVEF